MVEAEVLAAATLSVASTLLEEGVRECVLAVAEDAWSEAWKEKMDTLEERRLQFERNQLIKFWRRLVGDHEYGSCVILSSISPDGVTCSAFVNMYTSVWLPSHPSPHW